MYERRRNLVRRHDNKLVNVARFRGQLFVCANNCCCGRTEDGFAPVPADLYHEEWERRRLRNLVHLTIGGCLGPCALANVVLLLFDGRAFWFHSVNSDAVVFALYDFVEQLLEAGAALAPPAALASLQFTASTWQSRPDGQEVDDYRPRRVTVGRPSAAEAGCRISPADAPMRERGEADRLVADMSGNASAPRKNGELVFGAPWQGRAFGMAVALNEQELYPWDDFRERLVAETAAAEARGDGSDYYERWLAAFELLLEGKGILSRAEIEERAYQFEFGERDDVY